jgi:hypothetical protein
MTGTAVCRSWFARAGQPVSVPLSPVIEKALEPFARITCWTRPAPTAYSIVPAVTDGGRGRRAVHARPAETVNTTATTTLLRIVKWLMTRDGVPRASASATPAVAVSATRRRKAATRGRRTRGTTASAGTAGTMAAAWAATPGRTGMSGMSAGRGAVIPSR